MNERLDDSFALILAYYASLASAVGFQGRCSMSIPADIEGKRVLDVCCRKGKGAFALADAVGPSGFVVGVDPDAGNIAAARIAAPGNHRAGSSWGNHLRFSQAIPENLSAARIDDVAFDLVYINSVLNLAWSLPASLAEFARVLVPGGRLWVAQGVFADNESDVQGERAVPGDGASARGRSAVIELGVSMPDGSVAFAGSDAPALADRNGSPSALNGHMLIAGESEPIDVFSRALSRSQFKRMCLEAGFSSVAFSSISSLSGEDVPGSGCRRDAAFCLADACATI